MQNTKNEVVIPIGSKKNFQTVLDDRIRDQRTPTSLENDVEHQGVRSNIFFPLGQDEKAISIAIRNLLSEGWQFAELTKKRVALQRVWTSKVSAQREKIN